MKPEDAMNRNIDRRFVVPVEDGKFEFAFEGEGMEKYQLVFLDEISQGYLSVSLHFFPDGDVVEFTLYDAENRDKNKVDGVGLNRAMNDFEAEKERLFGEETEKLYGELDPRRARWRRGSRRMKS